MGSEFRRESLGFRGLIGIGFGCNGLQGLRFRG